MKKIKTTIKIKTIIITLICILSISTAYAAYQDVFILKLLYDKGEISAQLLAIEKGYFNEPADPPEEGYTIEIISYDDGLLYTQKFDFELELKGEPDPDWFDKEGNQIYFPKREETTLTIETADVEIILPYFSNAKQIDIYDKDDSLILTINLNQLTKKTKETSLQIKVILLFILIILLLTTIRVYLIKKKKPIPSRTHKP